ncbi:methyl-accepting chemotaxis protein McpH [Phenylobacterium zucineum HLK1]|uniref:Methyl-accepting chemotaxis protein McpH n=1 Tax=Phenylobacterium zucineum (strain HLK1) TaxID=450851 RepID=B4RAP7_PHEZH|nr:methyl-accepting chemotaxis protein [Phenylobacterium zucineum]ACG79645.1 methyl-accepting chemotaxis protein McpH [Phenylobacterium zucineum HLK1]
MASKSAAVRKASTVEPPTLFERLGGAPAVDAAVELFYAKVLADDRINRFFQGVDMVRQAGRQKAFLTMLMGGPNTYTGQNLRLGHRKLVAAGLDDSHFDAVVGHLAQTLRELGAAEDDIAEAGALAESARADVLNRDTEDEMAGSNAVARAVQERWEAAEGSTDLQALLEDYKGQVDAIRRSQAVIEFGVDGKILDANDNFLNALGYTIDEVRGQHHSMFVDPAERSSSEYRAFWDRLGRGEFDAGQYKRIAKGGREIWIQASYNPVFDASGKPYKVVKYASDITAEKLAAADAAGQLAAIDKAQAVIQFELDGTIIEANANFLGAVGYTADEVRGKHHSMFVDAELRASPEYRAFWDKLGRGEYDAGRYRRIGKGGREIWIQASYNPILDASGRPFKVVKYATDITEQVLREQENDRLSRVLDQAPFNVIVCEPQDLRINYVNKRTIDTLRGLQSLIPVPADKLLGESIDIFHKNPQMQRRLLADPNNLPHRATIKLGEEMMDLNVQALKSDSGAYIGVMLSWSVITEQLRFIGRVNDFSREVADAADNMRGMAQTMAASAEETSNQAAAVAAASDEASSNVQTVASAAEELSASIQEITRQVEQSSSIARQAVEEALATDETMRGLADSADRVGEVVGLIQEIASQTKLLALNATIESARAGEAGKGFAVVASEVKNLADQTAKATKQIAEQIGSIQKASNAAVSAIESIRRTIEQANEASAAIASAVEEQGAATQEITRNVQEAASGTREVSANISGVTDAAAQNSQSASDMLGATNALATKAEELDTLRAEIEAFMKK